MISEEGNTSVVTVIAAIKPQKTNGKAMRFSAPPTITPFAANFA